MKKIAFLVALILNVRAPNGSSDDDRAPNYKKSQPSRLNFSTSSSTPPSTPYKVETPDTVLHKADSRTILEKRRSIKAGLNVLGMFKGNVDIQLTQKGSPPISPSLSSSLPSPLPLPSPIPSIGSLLEDEDLQNKLKAQDNIIKGQQKDIENIKTQIAALNKNQNIFIATMISFVCFQFLYLYSAAIFNVIFNFSVLFQDMYQSFLV
jgi:hypothetical protein